MQNPGGRVRISPKERRPQAALNQIFRDRGGAMNRPRIKNTNIEIELSLQGARINLTTDFYLGFHGFDPLPPPPSPGGTIAFSKPVVCGLPPASVPTWFYNYGDETSKSYYQ